MEPLPAESLDKLALAMAKAQAEMPAITLDSKVNYKQVEFRYASLSNLIFHTKPILAKHGLSILQFPSTDGPHVRIDTMILHESGQRLESSISGRVANADDPKLLGSMITYLRRYSYGSILSIALDGDYDGEIISETYTELPEQKIWLRDVLQPMGVDKETMALVSREMVRGNYEMTEHSAAKALQAVSK